MQYERIKNLREDCDMTQKNVADMLYIKRSTYSNYENGTRAIPLELISKLADIFGTSVDYLLERTDEKKPYPKSKNTIASKIL